MVKFLKDDLFTQLNSRLTTVAKTNLKLLLSPEEKCFGGRSVFFGPHHTGRAYMYVTVIRKKRRKNKFIRSKMDLFAAMAYYIQSYL